MSINGTEPKRAIRSEQTFKKPRLFAGSNYSTKDSIEIVDDCSDSMGQVEEQFAPSDEVQNAAALAKAKLELLAKPHKHSPSSRTESSFPSTSFDDASSDSALSSPPPETPDLSPTQRNIEYVNNASLGLKGDCTSRCPVCKEKIDLDFLDEFAKGNRLTVRQQTQFCRAHKRHTATMVWEENHYPKIDWHRLDERLKNYHGAIDEILQGRKVSFYRNAFEDFINSRKERTLRKNLMDGNEIEDLTPGYYGSRGAKIM